MIEEKWLLQGQTKIKMKKNNFPWFECRFAEGPFQCESRASLASVESTFNTLYTSKAPQKPGEKKKKTLKPRNSRKWTKMLRLAMDNWQFKNCPIFGDIPAVTTFFWRPLNPESRRFLLEKKKLSKVKYLLKTVSCILTLSCYRNILQVSEFIYI